MNLDLLSQVRLSFPISDSFYSLSKALIKAQELCMLISATYHVPPRLGLLLSSEDVEQDVYLAWGVHCARCPSVWEGSNNLTQVSDRAESWLSYFSFWALLDLFCAAVLLFRLGCW